jgi:hypothetical protein
MWLHGLIVPSDYKEPPMPFYRNPSCLNFGITIPFLTSKSHFENPSMEWQTNPRFLK